MSIVGFGAQSLISNYIKDHNNQGFVKFSGKEIGQLKNFGFSGKQTLNVTYLPANSLDNNIDKLVNGIKNNKIFIIDKNGQIQLPNSIARFFEGESIDLNFKNFAEQQKEIQNIFKQSEPNQKKPTEQKTDAPAAAPMKVAVKKMTAQEEAEFAKLKEDIIASENPAVAKEEKNESKYQVKEARVKNEERRREERTEGRADKEKGKPVERNRVEVGGNESVRDAEKAREAKEKERELRDNTKRENVKEERIKKERLGL